MPKLDTLIASIFYQMTRHSQAPKAGFEHMEMLASHPECDSVVLKDAALRLSSTWRQEARLRENDCDTQPELKRLGKQPRFH